jgi:hypothetical protein
MSAVMPATMPAFYAEVWELFVSTRLELAMFFTAMVVYRVLHMHRLPTTSSKKLNHEELVSDANMSNDVASGKTPRDLHVHSQCKGSSGKNPRDLHNHSQGEGLRVLAEKIKIALRASNFSEVAEAFVELKTLWSSKGISEYYRGHLIPQVVEVACKERQLHAFLPNLEDVPLTEESVNAMLVECIRLRDSDLAHDVEALARKQDATLSDTTYALLIKAFTNDIDHAGLSCMKRLQRKAMYAALILYFRCLDFAPKLRTSHWRTNSSIS